MNMKIKMKLFIILFYYIFIPVVVKIDKQTRIATRHSPTSFARAALLYLIAS